MNNLQTQRKFKRFLPFVLLSVLMALALSACELTDSGEANLGPIDSGPNVWIEYPPEGETFATGTIPIVVYAASPEGVGGISVTVGGQPVPAGKLTSLAGDNTMVRTDLIWQPPAEGQYRIVASAGGAPAALTFCVVTCGTPETESGDQPEATPAWTSTATLPVITLPPNEPTWTPTVTPAPSDAFTATPANTEIPTPTPYISPMPSPTVYIPPTPTAYTESSAEFWSEPDSINSGECTTLNWKVYGDFQAVYLGGNSVGASGSDSECPAETTTYNLQVVEMDGSTSDYWSTVEVSAPPPADTSGPDINWTNLAWESCEFYGEAGISDESGVSWAQFYYNKNGEGWNSIWMSEFSTETWQAEIGVPVNDGSEIIVGSVEYYIVASDSLGNQSTSATSTYSYSSCDG